MTVLDKLFALAVAATYNFGDHSLAYQSLLNHYQNLVDEIERYRNEYGITESFINKTYVSKFRKVISLYVDKWEIPLDTLYDVSINQLYQLHKDGIVTNKKEAQRVIRLFKSGKTGKEIREGD